MAKNRKKYYNSMDKFSSFEGRKRQESEDSGMISEDRSAIANLPQNVMMKKYPKPDYFMYDLNDTIKGIDVQIDDDVRKEVTKTRKKYPEKY